MIKTHLLIGDVFFYSRTKVLKKEEVIEILKKKRG